MGKSKTKKKKSRRPVTEVRLDVDARKLVISRLHQLNKARHATQSDKQLSKAQREAQVKTIKQEIKEIGGLNAYQHVSKTSESRYGNFNSAKWVIQQLKELDILPKQKTKVGSPRENEQIIQEQNNGEKYCTMSQASELACVNKDLKTNPNLQIDDKYFKDNVESGNIQNIKVANATVGEAWASLQAVEADEARQQDLKTSSVIELLDVGALDLNYTAYTKHIHCTSVDLNPQKPGIIKADLLEYRLGESSVFDVVVLSLVLNFAGDPAVRGDILKRAVELTKLNGHLVIVLPLACVKNSRYLTETRLNEMLDSLGCSVINSHQSKKLAFCIACKQSPAQSKSFPKTEVANGTHHNNFCIVLQ